MEKNGFVSRMLFSELYKIMANTVTFVDFRGRRWPQTPLLKSALGHQNAVRLAWQLLRIILSLAWFRNPSVGIA